MPFRINRWVIAGWIGVLAISITIISVNAFQPDPFSTCLQHGENAFQLFATVEIIVDDEPRLLPVGIGKVTTEGEEECVQLIHTDEVGNNIHIQYVRPIRLTMQDFMKVYSESDGRTTITVINNSTGSMMTEVIELDRYDAEYYYFEDGETVLLDGIDNYPPFTDKFKARIVLTSHGSN